MAATCCSHCNAFCQQTSTLCTACGGFISGPRSVPVGQESPELLAAMASRGQRPADRSQATIYQLATETAEALRAAEIEPGSIGEFRGWCVWSHRHLSEEWPPPKPGAAPEQAIHNVEACWLAPDGRLYWLSYEEMERFGWIMYPEPRQGGPRGTTVLGEPSTTLLDDAKLSSVWEFLVGKPRSNWVTESGNAASSFPAALGDCAGPHELIRRQLASLPSRAAKEEARARLP